MDLRTALELGHDLMAEHGLEDWSLGLDRAKTRAGATHWSTRQITLSAPLTLLHDEDEVRDTILHEVAHAIAGPRAGHGPAWQRVARSIGCSAARCLSADTPVVPGEWVGRCAAGHEVTRHRTPTRVVSCTRCRRGFSAHHLLDWTHRGRRVPMHPSYAAELKALTSRTAPAPVPDTASVVTPGGRVRIGDRVRITASGRYAGVAGTVTKRGRTRWHVRVEEGTLTVPFGLVERVEERVRESERESARGSAPAGRPVAQTLFDL